MNQVNDFQPTAELEQWLAYAVLTGHGDADIVAQLAPSGYDRKTLESYLSDLRKSPLLAVGQDFARQLSQTRWLLELQKSVTYSEREVPRLPASEVQRFYDDFLSANRPVVLEGFCDSWPARQRWNYESLKERLADQAMEYTRYVVVNNRHEAEKVEGSFGEFLDRIYDPADEEPIYWTAYNQGETGSELVKALKDDIHFPEDYCAPAPDLKTFFWIGPAGTRSGLHFDPYNVLFVQAVGRKRFILYPPHDIPKAYLENDYFSQVDAESPDLQRFPKFADTKPLVVDVNEGETLLLPVGWLHQVRSLSVSMSVSLTCLKLPNGKSNFYSAPSEYRGIL